LFGDLIDALACLAELDEHELLDELFPELAVMCEYRWLLELIVAYCKQRG